MFKIVKYLHSINCPYDHRACKHAAFYGRIDCLKYAHEIMKCEINTSLKPDFPHIGQNMNN